MTRIEEKLLMYMTVRRWLCACCLVFIISPASWYIGRRTGRMEGYRTGVGVFGQITKKTGNPMYDGMMS